METKTLAEISTELQALSTVTEDQFEASLASVVADLQAFIAAQPVTAAPTVLTVVVNFTDGTSQTVPPATTT